ncbi:ABC-2 type transport system permease protein/capsular polysaccharide transport system permease protein [Sphingobium sp. AP50]|uniref:ABC transporter permease n=1 Tax=Sphingobium sp. AP50 TaxID=1884369 RepID=UPI0008D62EFD|nr:ABC transporter permease [Sphingobium sp. AP50]SEJ78742.1 ABC-2 type transport system permease protein/capsular polysaccharide transport system permease protein [Sphingobium sp. AP50]
MSMQDETDNHGVREGWAVQRRVIGALLRREMITRYGRHNIGFLWLFVEPMVFTIGIVTLWNLTKSVHGSDLPITAFAVTGYSSVLVWRNMPSRLIGSIEPNLSLMYHRNVKIIDIFLSRLVLEMSGVATSFVVLTLFFATMGWLSMPEDVIKVVEGWGMLAWFGSSMAMFLGAVSHRHELIDKFWHPCSYLLFPLSGAAYLVDSLPQSMQSIVLWLPMVHGVECVRDGFFGSHFTPHYDLGYMALVCITLMGLALIQIRAVERELVPQ